MFLLLRCALQGCTCAHTHTHTHIERKKEEKKGLPPLRMPRVEWHLTVSDPRDQEPARFSFDYMLTLGKAYISSYMKHHLSYVDYAANMLKCLVKNSRAHVIPFITYCWGGHRVEVKSCSPMQLSSFSVSSSTCVTIIFALYFKISMSGWCAFLESPGTKRLAQFCHFFSTSFIFCYLIINKISNIQEVGIILYGTCL